MLTNLYTVQLSVCDVYTSGRSPEAIRPEIKLISSCRASVEHYSSEPTDTASSGTSSEVNEALCNSAREKLDREVSLRVVAKRR